MPPLPDWATPAAIVGAVSAALGAAGAWLRAGGDVRKARAEALEIGYGGYADRLTRRVDSLEKQLKELHDKHDQSEEARHRLTEQVTMLRIRLDNVKDEAEDLRAILATERKDHDAERADWHRERLHLLQELDERNARIVALEARVAKLEAELSEPPKG